MLHELTSFGMEVGLVLQSCSASMGLPEHLVELGGHSLSEHFVHFLQSKELLLVVDMPEFLLFHLLNRLLLKLVKKGFFKVY